MSAPMLEVESKASEATDFIKPLSKYIKSEFDADTLGRHSPALEQVNDLREDVRLGTEKTEASLNRLRQYLSTLCLLQRHFPVSENDVRVSFQWYQFASRKSASRFSLQYEGACVKFNCAAVASQIAVLQNRASDDGLKLACKYFQLAAGIFRALKEDLLKQPASLRATKDLSEDALMLLEHLMLAQAQECFFDKVARSNLPSSLVSQVASGVADYYDTALTLTESADAKAAVPSKWEAHLMMRMAMFSAISDFHASEECRASRKFGHQVAYLSRAVQFLDSITSRQIKNSPPEFARAFQAEKEKISHMFGKAQGDNNSIYHENVPGSVPTAVKKEMVKATPFEVVVPPSSEDPFRELVSPAIRQAIERYNERKGEKVREELGKLEEANDIHTSSLQSMGLPGAIQSLDNPTGIPAEVEASIAKFKDQGGGQHIHELRGMLDKLSKEATGILNEALRVLDEEEQEDNQMQSSFGARWTRTPSHTLTGNLRQEASKYRLNVEHATKSDAYIQRKFDDHAQMFSRLSGTRESIVHMLPQARAVDAAGLRSVEALKALLAQLDAVCSQRMGLMEQLKLTRDADDISGTLIASPHAPVEGIMEEALQKYEKFNADIQASIDQQNTLLTQISQANEEFVRSRGGKIGGNDRDRVLCEISAALSSYNELIGNLSEGIRFYTNFQELLCKFRQRCNDFAMARRTEKLELLNQLTATSPSGGGSPYQSHSQQHAPQQQYYSPPPQQSTFQSPAMGQAPPGYQHAHPQQQQAPPQYQQFMQRQQQQQQQQQQQGGGGGGFTPLLQPGSTNVPGGGNPYMYRPPQ
eukprot:TRINITY_DN865_c0_g1_i2.p1 TRINITY_DN865_c0_g1~~TRINITY_DN865_c0_g1_i2.p1  ORF type:complete len:840 (-),score=251.45 TRINITY_DN865_c0_g1_i2:138-2582(-)